MGNVQRLQDGLKKLWTDELYSDQFRSSPSKYKDFDHALKHVRKAAQALENMTEEADHGADSFDANAVKKYVADLMICAIRLANVSPTGALDLEDAVFDRIERKMGVRLEQEANYWIYPGERRSVVVKAATQKEAEEKVRKSPNYDGFNATVFRVEDFAKMCTEDGVSP